MVHIRVLFWSPMVFLFTCSLFSIFLELLKFYRIHTGQVIFSDTSVSRLTKSTGSMSFQVLKPGVLKLFVPREHSQRVKSFQGPPYNPHTENIFSNLPFIILDIMGIIYILTFQT